MIIDLFVQTCLVEDVSVEARQLDYLLFIMKSFHAKATVKSLLENQIAKRHELLSKILEFLSLT